MKSNGPRAGIVALSIGFTGVAQDGGVGEAVSVGSGVSVGAAVCEGITEAVTVTMAGMDICVDSGCMGDISVAIACGEQDTMMLASKRMVMYLFILFSCSPAFINLR